MRRICGAAACAALLAWLLAPVQAQTTCNGFTPDRWAAPADVGTGDGSTRANAMDLPTALSTQTAGMTICAIPGTYIGAGSLDPKIPTFRAVTSGSAGDPSIITCEYQAIDMATPESDANRCELQYTGGTPGGSALLPLTNPVFGVGEDTTRSYIYWYGFYVNEANAPAAPDGGVFKAGAGDHMALYNSVIKQTTNYTWGLVDNFVKVFCRNSDDFVIRNNRFIGRNNTPTSVNQTDMTTYGCKRFLAENNSHIGTFTGYFVKGSNEDGGDSDPYNDGIIRYNYFEDGYTSVVLNECNAGVTCDAYQNVSVRPIGAAFMARNDGAPTAKRNNRFYNNTAYDIVVYTGGNDFATCIYGVVNHTASVFKNNVCMYSSSTASAYMHYWDNGASPTGFTITNNCYFESGATAQWVAASTTYNGIAAWRTGQSQDPSGTPGSFETNPNFTNAAAGNFRIASGSCLTASDTSGPVGAYITGSESIGASASVGGGVGGTSGGRGRLLMRGGKGDAN